MRPLRPLRPWLLLLSVNSVASEFSEFSEYLNEFSELAEAYVRRLAKVPDWRQIPGDTDWFEGCGYGNYDIRGAIAAGLEHNKVRKHVAICLGHCGPPSCTLKMAESNCNCLHCTMFCMSRASYVDSCLNNHTRDLCLGFQSIITAVTNQTCNPDCNGTARLLLGHVALLLMLVSWSR
ncbi:unnamed protein product [Effrenium voratum]|uniref:Uncharacterized protein n=1 Tax=Effrenium voratum TaxID=2562239 RepID=A0AA36HME5_9DINO|nr:unnamed protein product [Effrenium voratum]CAJ1459661.1 unnamed protein product [Effrenium voratum]